MLNSIKLIRRLKGGFWIKTKKRGWIEFETYNDYLSYGFDPVCVSYEDYEKDPIGEKIKEREKIINSIIK